MGLFKDSLNTDLKYSFLIKLGFRYGSRSGTRGESGYTKTINHNGNERLWITVNPVERKLYLYNEWDFGGMLWDRCVDIPSNVLENNTDFVDWLDSQT